MSITFHFLKNLSTNGNMFNIFKSVQHIGVCHIFPCIFSIFEISLINLNIFNNSTNKQLISKFDGGYMNLILLISGNTSLGNCSHTHDQFHLYTFLGICSIQSCVRKVVEELRIYLFCHRFRREHSKTIP